MRWPLGWGSLLLVACGSGSAASPGGPGSTRDAAVTQPDAATKDASVHDAMPREAAARDTSPPKDTSVPDVMPAKGIFVAVGYGGRRIRSADGMTWTDDASLEAMGGDDDALLRAVAYGGKQFVAVGWRVMTSPDGVAWTDHGVMSQWLGGLAWAKSTWVAVGGYGRRSTSSDGVTFTDVPDTGTAAYRSLAYGDYAGGTWMAMGDGGRLSTTTDGTTYTELTAIALGGATYGPTGFLGIVSANLEVSGDGGGSWTVAGTAPASLDSVIYAGGQYVAVGSGNAVTSPDGTHWTSHAVAKLGGSVAFGNGVYAACGGGSCPTCCFVSTDGASWTAATVPAGDTNALQSVAFGGD